MNINKKGSVNIILIILVVILAGTVLYLALVKKPTLNSTIVSQTTTTQQIQPVATTTNNIPPVKPSSKIINWESLLPEIRVVAKQAFPTGIEDPSFLILEKGDVTGDGLTEAMVDLGSAGAASEYATLMRVENGKPIVAIFKQKNGEIAPLLFRNGAGGAGRYGMGFSMLKDKNAVYSASYSAYGDSTDSCNADAYQWNAQTKIFEYNLSLSNTTKQDYCNQTKQKLNEVGMSANF